MGRERAYRVPRATAAGRVTGRPRGDGRPTATPHGHDHAVWASTAC